MIGDNLVIIASCLIAGFYSLLSFDWAVAVNFNHVVDSIIFRCVQKYFYHAVSISQDVVRGSADDEELFFVCPSAYNFALSDN